MNQTVRIVLIDDHEIFRRGVEAVLATRPDMQVVGQAGDGVEGVDLVRKLRPDIVLMDIGMPNCDGLEATRQIKREMPEVRVLVVTVSDDDDDLYEALRSGAQGYLTKDLKARVLLDTVEGIARGEAAFSGVIAAKILHEFQSAQDPTRKAQAVDPLSAREIEVLELVVDGQSNKEISEALRVSESTVKNHLRNVLEKLHLKNRVQVAVYAVRQGLTRERPPRDT